MIHYVKYPFRPLVIAVTRAAANLHHVMLFPKTQDTLEALVASFFVNISLNAALDYASYFYLCFTKPFVLRVPAL
jgi:hypothetical protein